MKLATKSASHFSDCEHLISDQHTDLIKMKIYFILVESPPPEIPTTNKGNKMLQKMGWQPGTSIGADPSNPNSLINPIMPVKRPNKIGLGFIGKFTHN